MAACDGIAQGHEGMRYILPTRDLIANSIELMVEAHRLDGVIMLGSCDKIVPGIALDVPALIVVGGPMEGGCEFDGRASDGTSLTEALGMLHAGRITEAEFIELENHATPTCGSCSFLGTANTMCCVAEAIGMCLPGSATIPATHADRMRSAQAAGRQIVRLVQGGITARRIINRLGLENGMQPRAAHARDRVRGRLPGHRHGALRGAVPDDAAHREDEPRGRT